MSNLSHVQGELVDQFLRFGVFNIFKRLKDTRGVAPSRGLYVLGRTLADISSGEQARPVENFEEWIASRLNESWSRYGQDHLGSLEDLARRCNPVVRWSPYEGLADILVVETFEPAIQSVRWRLGKKGFDVQVDSVRGWAQLFSTDQLIRALRSFDLARGEGKESAWLSTVLYRFSIRHALIERRVLSVYSVTLDIPDFRQHPEIVLDERDRVAALKDLQRAMCMLPPLSRRALELYFGMQSREHTISEIGQEMGVSPYLARCAVIHAVAGVAANLKVSGLLDSRELDVARALFVEGYSCSEASRKLGISEAETRKVSHSIGHKVRSVLRLRTVRDDSAEINKESRMMSSFTLAGRKKTDQASMDIRDEAAISSEGIVGLSGRSQSFELSAEGVQGGNGAEAILNDLEDSPRLLAEKLLTYWFASHPEREKEHSSDVDEVNEFIKDSLSAMSSALDEVVPWKLRLQLTHSKKTKIQLRVYRIDSNDKMLRAQWLPLSDSDEGFDLTALVMQMFRLIGPFSHEEAQELCDEVVLSLGRGEVVFPGFRPASSLESNVWHLEWLPPEEITA